ncbi:uncharacterized protein LOC110062308 [Orbicella faveolata]|uniref:uncharacterized protein LOC110062308 n=1 Tax=Orbicella faveolata TaxID=48498 RepID=UPI0009E434A2|nr:uncharacterized protein LOC110062308 [Orbicella faveolata]
MVQRSISPCFFGNKVTMAFKLIFVFAVIAVFAVDALKLTACAKNRLLINRMKLTGGTLVGFYRVKDKFLRPTRYEITVFGRTFKGSINGCNGLRKWVASPVNCNPGGWRWFRLKSFKAVSMVTK